MKEILLIQLRQLGDIILTTPCIRELKREFPEARISFLTHSMGRMVLKDNPWLDQLYTFDEKSLINECKLIAQLREVKFDIVLDFMNNPRSAIYSILSNGSLRLSYRSKRRFAYHRTISRGQGFEYIVREKFRLLNEVGCYPTNAALSLPWFLSDTLPMQAFAGEIEKIAPIGCRVVLSPTHRRRRRQWPSEKYAQLSDLLVEKWGAAVIWIWGPGEEDFIDSVMKKCHSPTLKAPKTSFRELAALIANCDLFIGNSNGPSHVAVANNILSLQIHGPTSAAAWCPNNDIHRSIQGDRTSTDPIATVTLADVWDLVEKFRVQVDVAAARRQVKGLNTNWT